MILSSVLFWTVQIPQQMWILHRICIFMKKKNPAVKVLIISRRLNKKEVFGHYPSISMQEKNECLSDIFLSSSFVQV